VSVFVKIET